MKIGIISDTHNFLDPRIPGLFAGVEHILHGGDIGQPGILRKLEETAPVTAVCGNTDDPGFGYPMTAAVALGSRSFLVHHILNPHRLGDTLQERVKSERTEIIIFGHAHKPFAEWLGGIFFLNPGYAGRNRFGMERSVAILTLDGADLRWEYLPL